MTFHPASSARGFTLVEQMVALSCGLLVLAAVLTAGVALQRSFAAVEGYSSAEGDQLRVQDYIGMDCRRAVRADVTTDPITTASILTLTIPAYYDGTGAPVDPTHPANAGIQYGAGTIPISYYRSGDRFMRQVNGVESAIATNVASFTVTPLDITSTVTCSITFAPRFTSVPYPGPVNGTMVFSNTFLRNAIARQ